MSRPNLHHSEHSWFDNKGYQPVGPDIEIRVTYANGVRSKDPHPACWWTNWKKRGNCFDIASWCFADPNSEDAVAFARSRAA